MFSNKWFSSLLIKNDCERKKKDTLGDITWYAIQLATTLAFQNGRERSRTTTLTCKTFLVVNHPEIALTLEKCLIQGKIIVCFTWTERFFRNYAIFLDIFKLSHVASTKV